MTELQAWKMVLWLLLKTLWLKWRGATASEALALVREIRAAQRKVDSMDWGRK